MYAKKNISLVIGIAIPLLMILFVAGSIYVPTLFVKPASVNFLYETGDEYPYAAARYVVEKGKLTKDESSAVQNQNSNYPSVKPQISTKLFVHDVAKNESREVSFEEAQALSLNTNVLSPDGFEIVNGSNGGGVFPFFYSGNDYNSRYLSGHGVSKKLNLRLNNGNYYGSFRFLGWIQ